MPSFQFGDREKGLAFAGNRAAVSLAGSRSSKRAIFVMSIKSTGYDFRRIWSGSNGL